MKITILNIRFKNKNREKNKRNLKVKRIVKFYNENNLNNSLSNLYLKKEIIFPKIETFK